MSDPFGVITQNPVLQINPAPNLIGANGAAGFNLPPVSGPSPPRPYKNVPDTLMGFRKNGTNKASDETNYPVEQWVHVDFGNGNSFVDAMRGLNPLHALERAYRNWDSTNPANITPITPQQAQQIDPSLFPPQSALGLSNAR